MDEHQRRSPFVSAGEEARAVAESDAGFPDSFRLAYADVDFLCRDELRPVRLQTELLKAEILLQEQNVGSTVVVFGSARIPAPDDARRAGKDSEGGDTARRLREKSNYYDQAREFARRVSELGQGNDERHFVVVTGGGPGIMEAANRGAADAGAVSAGLNIALPSEQRPNDFVTPELNLRFHYFALRKMHFLMRARALVFFPGGFGTMDELFETLTLIQTRKIEPIPVLLFGEAYWRRIINFDAMVDEGVISEEDLRILRFVATPEEACALVVGG